MSAKQKSVLQVALPILCIIGAVGTVWVSMSMDAAVLGEQIRTVKCDTRQLKASDEKHELKLYTVEHNLGGRVGTIERDMAGINASMSAIKDISVGNAKKLDRLLSNRACYVQTNDAE